MSKSSDGRYLRLLTQKAHQKHLPRFRNSTLDLMREILNTLILMFLAKLTACESINGQGSSTLFICQDPIFRVLAY